MSTPNYTDNDIQQAWKKMSDLKFSNSNINKEEIMEAIKQESNSTISTLKKNLKMKIYWVYFFLSVFSVGLIYNIQNTEFAMLMGLLIIIYAAGLAFMYPKYRSMDAEIPHDRSVLATSKHNLQQLQSALKAENLWAMFILPLSPIIGVLLAKTARGGTIMSVLTDTKILILLLIVVVIGVPLMMILTKKMNAIAYGNDIKTLTENIVRMETLG